MRKRSWTTGLALLATCMAFAQPAQAKSLYMIANINASPTPIRTYDIQGPPNYLVFQATQGVPAFFDSVEPAMTAGTRACTTAAL